ncbi:MAG: tRNA 2-thiocytidine(32) synthetase TtcA, partial [Deltaproteobacteria bacterium]|nr:tRNA 2-thiocytidine(32) synthetase TtcA [Deltaproteobacteria bacterium]
PGFPAHVLESWFREIGVEHRIVRQDVYPVIQQLTPIGKTMCSACSRLRRGILYTTAVELGCTKIALGHHREDLVETLLLSAFFAGALKSMPPKLLSDDGRNTVIRPLAYCPEAELAEYAQRLRLPVIPCGACAEQESSQRRHVKHLISELAREHPSVPGNLLNALANVTPSHLLDRSLRRAKPTPE